MVSIKLVSCSLKESCSVDVLIIYFAGTPIISSSDFIRLQRQGNKFFLGGAVQKIVEGFLAKYPCAIEAELFVFLSLTQIAYDGDRNYPLEYPNYL